MSERRNIPAIVKYMLIATLLLLGIKYFEVITKFAGTLFSVATPLILGVAIAYVLNILVSALEKRYFPHSHKTFVKKTRRPFCIIFALLIIISIIFLIFIIVIPQLISAIKLLLEGIPELLTLVENQIERLSNIYPVLSTYTGEINFDTQSIIGSLLSSASSLLSGFFTSSISVAGTISGWVINFVIALIFAIYILLSKEKLKSQCQRVMRAYLKPHTQNKFYTVLNIANDSFSSYITGQCTEAVILGSLCALGMWIFRFPYASMIGTFIGATALIPIVGAYLGATLGVIMILTVSPVKAALFILYILILQQVEGNVIYPKVVGSSIGLPGMWVLAAVTIGGGIGGILGMIIGVPLAATLYKLTRLAVNKRLARE